MDRICIGYAKSDYELKKSGGVIVEQVIRPTGLVDPQIDVRPLAGQIDDLMEEIRQRTERQRQRPYHNADQANGGKSNGLFRANGCAGTLPAFGH